MQKGDKVITVDLKKEGWENSNQTWADLQIWRKGNELMLYDLKAEKVYMVFSV